MPEIRNFKTREEYNKWFSAYRAKNREKIRTYNREYMRKRRKKLCTGRSKNVIDNKFRSE